MLSTYQLKIKYFFLFFVLFTPFFSLANSVSDYYNKPLQTASLLNPDELFKALRENITVPLTPDTTITLPTPQQSLKDAEKLKPKIDEINKEVQEESGVDLKKFTSFIAKITITIFKVIISVLEDFVTFLK